MCVCVHHNTHILKARIACGENMLYLSESVLPHLVCYLKFIHFLAHFIFLYRALASTVHMQHIFIIHSALDERLN